MFGVSFSAMSPQKTIANNAAPSPIIKRKYAGDLRNGSVAASTSGHFILR